MTISTNIEDLQVDNALNSERFCGDIPETIKDAMRVVEVIQERYLWVDSLCYCKTTTQRDRCSSTTCLRSMQKLVSLSSLRKGLMWITE